MDRTYFFRSLAWLCPPPTDLVLHQTTPNTSDMFEGSVWTLPSPSAYQDLRAAFWGLCCFLLPEERVSDCLVYFNPGHGKDATQTDFEILHCNHAATGTALVLFVLDGATYCLRPELVLELVLQESTVPFVRIRFSHSMYTYIHLDILLINPDIHTYVL